MTTASKPLRLFFAAPIDDAVRARARACIERLREAGGDVRWTPPDSMHLTLRFLGAASPRLVPALGRAVDEAARGKSAFGLTFDKLGYFGRKGRPDVIWAGVGEGSETLGRLAAALEAALAKEGVAREERPFKAHLTLGRVRSHGGLRPLAQAIENAPALGWPLRVERIVLYSSDLRQAAAVHSELHVSELAACSEIKKGRPPGKAAL